MRRRRTAEDVARALREADHDLAKGLPISDICCKQGIAEATYNRWRQQHDPAQIDTDRRCRELERETDRLKRLVAELLLDKQMLQEIPPKVVTPDQQQTAAAFLGFQPVVRWLHVYSTCGSFPPECVWALRHSI